jgi:hypothetical protein
MKGFLKFLGTIVGVFSAGIGALFIFDRITQKNRIKDGYLECEVPEAEEEQ